MIVPIKQIFRVRYISPVTTTFFFFILILAILSPLTGMGQPFQRNFGNTLDNGFTKVIQDGSNYYIL